jgi:hypothetical protein
MSDIRTMGFSLHVASEEKPKDGAPVIVFSSNTIDGFCIARWNDSFKGEYWEPVGVGGYEYEIDFPIMYWAEEPWLRLLWEKTR